MKLNDVYKLAREQGNKEVCRFMRDMKKAGLVKQMKFYCGRWFWRGPAVSCDSIQDVMSNTKVPCQWDNLGLGYIVYPKARVQVKE